MSNVIDLQNQGESASVWSQLRLEAASAAATEPTLASMLHAVILNHDNIADALSYILASKIGDANLNQMQVREVCSNAFSAKSQIMQQVEADAIAVQTRDPAAKGYLQPFLFFKGFQALQAYRVAHYLWKEGRETLAHHFQSRISELFGVDIHPAAIIGQGIMIDHATSIVIGATAVVGNDVSMLHSVTLGGTGAEEQDRHPKIGTGVLIGAGAKVLGNIKIGDFARVAAGSVVLQAVPPRCTVAGVPAKPVGECCPEPAKSMNHVLDTD
ncbi:Serine acetyltransferase [hydrothermal vent metagenome]|uniref:serine O-acetyltransferase n=1 Tax=hydrothermal vent metagenome TaxID=652676 RepID=A0A3B0S6C3_9ZZZZ